MKIDKFIVTFMGVGLLPKAPGTFGTLATIPLAMALMSMGSLFHMAFILLGIPLAVWACELYQNRSGAEHDRQEIVIDEVFGYLITMVWLPLTWQSLLLGFILFRILDIFKPFPIGLLDKKVKGGLGVMADDIAAGLIANFVLQIIYLKTDWLGAQIWLSSGGS
jgi:phosphatidylglycerophosphatase A